MTTITFKIVELGAVLEQQNKGWNVEINKVSWNGNPAKWEVRPWDATHERCGKGIALSDAALKNLAEFIAHM